LSAAPHLHKSCQRARARAREREKEREREREREREKAGQSESKSERERPNRKSMNGGTSFVPERKRAQAHTHAR
jgi:hypothetical protein